MPRLAMQLLSVVAVILCGDNVRADDWPNRSITFVVPYAAGGPTDTVGRLFAQHMSETLGRPIIVENVPGAGGMTGANRVTLAAPDGYQVLFGGSGNLVFNQILYAKPVFNSLTDFIPVGLLTEQSSVLIARKDLPANNLHEFATYLKANKPNFGSAGVGSSTHLGCVMLNLALHVDATHVPYRAMVAAHQDLIGGRIDYVCDFLLTALPQIKAGLVKPLAVLSPSRSALLPDLPTVGELGFADVDSANWYGLFLPKGTPLSIVQKLHEAASVSLETPSFRARLQDLGVEPVARERRTPDYLARYLKEDIARWTAPIKASGAMLN
jgi:tripartite-type tricarboxylate transporter receptor subunit TctC